MLIAIDIWGTYDQDPETWDRVIQNFRAEGHRVIGVSGGKPGGDHRHESAKRLEQQGVPVYWTDQRSKKTHLKTRHRIEPDIWIDDRPERILKGPKDE